MYTWWVGSQLRHCGRGCVIDFPCCVYQPRAITIGDGVMIKAYAWLNAEVSSDGTPSLRIGPGSCLGRFVHINARESVVIEPSVLFAERVFVTDYTHCIDDRAVPVMHQPLSTPRPVRVGTGAWIGEGAVIMPGVTIGRNAVVGANAVVTHDVPAYHVAVGVPARARPIADKQEKGQSKCINDAS